MKALILLLTMLIFTSCTTEDGETIDVEKYFDAPSTDMSKESTGVENVEPVGPRPELGEVVDEWEDIELDRDTFRWSVNRFRFQEIAGHNDDYNIIIVLGGKLITNRMKPTPNIEIHHNMSQIDHDGDIFADGRHWFARVPGRYQNPLSHLEPSLPTALLPVVSIEPLEEALRTDYLTRWKHVLTQVEHYWKPRGVYVDAIVTCFGPDDTVNQGEKYESLINGGYLKYAPNIVHLCENATTPEEVIQEFSDLLQ